MPTIPLIAPNGKPWNFLVVQLDDMTLDGLGASAAPLFNANWASGFVNFPRGSCNSPLCLPGRAATLTGLRMENHRGWDNNEGANLDLTNTFMVWLQRAGYFTGGAGKWLNGFGESGNGGFGTQGRQPGHDWHLYQWGPPNYFDYDLLDVAGNLTHKGTADTRAAYTDVSATDYAVDVEGDAFATFAALAAAKGQPWVFYWTSKGPHQDSGNGGKPIPPARHTATAVTLTEESSFGVDPDSLGIPSWCRQAGENPWTDTIRDDIRDTHRKSLRTMRAVDETLHRDLTLIGTQGWASNTVVIIKTDNVHASGELRLSDKGTPHRSSAMMGLRVKVPGVAGGTCNAAVSDIDIAPFMYALAGVRPGRQPDGMSFHKCFANLSWIHREAAPVRCFKDSPAHTALRFADGRVHYRISDDSNKGAGQEGGWADAEETTNVNHPDGPLKLAAIVAAGPQGHPDP